jgi:hypothetical protein
MKSIKNFFIFLWLYIGNILIAIDQLGNTIMAGGEDETISSRAGRRWPSSWWAKFIDLLFFAQKIKTGKRHVIQAIEPPRNARRDLIPENMTSARAVKYIVWIILALLIIYIICKIIF